MAFGVKYVHGLRMYGHSIGVTITISRHSMGCLNTLSMALFSDSLQWTRTRTYTLAHTDTHSLRFTFKTSCNFSQLSVHHVTIVGTPTTTKTPTTTTTAAQMKYHQTGRMNAAPAATMREQTTVAETILKETPTNTLFEIYGFANKWKNIVPQMHTLDKSG